VVVVDYWSSGRLEPNSILDFHRSGAAEPQLQSVSEAKLPIVVTFVCDARQETVVAGSESPELEPEVEPEGSELQPGDDFLEIEIGKMEVSDL
jgi:hypothetical protein